VTGDDTMKYDLNMEQKLLKDSARDFFSKECDSTFVREMAASETGYTDRNWKKIKKLGWTGILIPEHYEGIEMSFLEMSVLLYEMGYACFQGPLFATAVLGVTTLLEADNDFHNKTILPEVAMGDQIITLAWVDPVGTLSTSPMPVLATRQDNNYILFGTKMFVPYAHIADTIICAARLNGKKDEEAITLFIVDAESPGISIKVLDTISGDKLCEVIFDNVSIPKENLLTNPDQGGAVLERVLQKAAVARCAEMCGGAQKVLEMVVDFAKTRVQFDRPIGSFQAIQHHCADILTYVETSKFMAYQSAWRISQALSFEKEASMSKAWTSSAYRKLTALGHQVMGGTGFMEETDLQLYFKHAKAAEIAFGDADYHREKVAQQLGL